MAKITKSEKKVTEVTLRLTKDEADAVFTIAGVIAGSAEPKKHLAKVWDALKKAGAERADTSGLTDFIKWTPEAPKPDYEPLCGLTGCTNASCKPTTSYYTSVKF